MDQTATEASDGHVALLLAELAPSRKTTIVDIGANPVNPAPYGGLLAMGGCRVIGFEPHENAYMALQNSKSPEETYFPFAVGTGDTIDLRLYVASGMTSIFDPDLPSLEAIGSTKWGRVKGKVQMATVALDQVPDLPPFDMMKIDIQGAETLVFQGATHVLANCCVVIVELRYLRMYVGEPMMGGVDSALRGLGFGLHKFLVNKTKMLTNSQQARLRPRANADQLIDGDAVYVRGIGSPGGLSEDQLKHLALLAAAVFASHSLALYCLDELAARGAVRNDLPSRYVDHLPERLRADGLLEQKT